MVNESLISSYFIVIVPSVFCVVILILFTIPIFVFFTISLKDLGKEVHNDASTTSVLQLNNIIHKIRVYNNRNSQNTYGEMIFFPAIGEGF